MRTRPAYVPAFLTCLAILAAGAGIAVAAAGDSSTGGQGFTLSVGEWRTTFRSTGAQLDCDMNYPDTVCAEWCEGEGANMQPTGILCCIDPQYANKPGMTLADCDNHLR